MDAARTMELEDLGQLAAVRRFVAAAADELGAQVDRGDLALVIGELAANALLHGGAPARIEVAAGDDGGLVLRVHDASSTLPEVVRGDPWDATGHRGMVLVETLAASWGAEVEPGGKQVWAHLAPAPVSPRSAARRG
ncbi:MAG: ATP-binding protein [Acidimicrobiales bacterium]